MSQPVIKIADHGAECHPTKIAVFSAEDLPEATSPVYRELVSAKPVVEVDGVVMGIRVSAYVPKGMVIVVDRAALDQLVEKVSI